MCRHACATGSTDSALSRRRLLTAGAGLAAAAAWPGGRPALASGSAQRAGGLPSAEEALELLMEGNARFAAGEPLHRPAPDWKTLAQGQAPIAVVLGCADSRVPPELVFDQGAGDLFVVRVAGNFVTDYGLASIEYAIAFLETPLVVVLGHSGCGAVGAAVEVVREGVDLPGELDQLVGRITPVVRRVEQGGAEDLLAASIEENVRANVERLTGIGEVLPQRIAEGKLRVVGAVDDIATASVRLL